MPAFISPEFLRLTGAAGTLIIILGSLLPALVYCGKRGERYSPLNHFISELGEQGVSRWAWMFNAGLILGGVCVLLFVSAFGLYVSGWLAWIGLAAGVVASLALIGVGLLPMNKLEQHSAVATAFFRAGLVMLIFYTLAVFFQPAGVRNVPLAVGFFGLPGIVSYAWFLTISGKSGDEPAEVLEAASDAPANSLAAPEHKPRPRFWLIAAVEWSIFITTVLWFGAVGLGVN